MQPGYGISEFQQFMVDGCCSPLFSIASDINNSSSQPENHQQNPNFQINSIPITQQFFQQHHQFQASLHQQLSLGKSGSRDGLHEEDSMNREEESTIKEPFWRPLDIDYFNSSNKKCKDNLESSNKYTNRTEGEEHEEPRNNSRNYGLFGELEAIYTIGSGGRINQTASGSALTGNNRPTTTAAEEEASLKNLQKNRRKRKRKHLRSIASFLESLVRQVMDHQEGLQKKFLEVMEKRDQERNNREEAWRRREAEKSNCEAISRAQRQALASGREAAIVSFLEKITGESIDLPSQNKFQLESQFQEETHKEDEPMELMKNNSTISSYNNTSRWPIAEVQALIRVRSDFESKFREPGLKGPLWEEVSSSMASMGYNRSAKRCKEKWENINKYFRKTKDNAKKGSKHSNTCPYFHQLDQLYSKSLNGSPNPSPIVENIDNSELLDTVVGPAERTSIEFDQIAQSNSAMQVI